MHREQSEDEADRLVAATLYLISFHARTGCPRVAYMVEQHLRAIGRHPGVSERVRDFAKKISSAWKVIADCDAARAARAGDDRDSPRPERIH